MRWTAACSPRYRLIPATTGVSRELAGVHPQPVRKRDFSVAYPVLTQQFTSVTHGSDLAVTLNRQIPGIGGASGQARQPSNWRSTEASSAGGTAVQSQCRIGRGPGPSRCRRRALKVIYKLLLNIALSYGTVRVFPRSFPLMFLVRKAHLRMQARWLCVRSCGYGVHDFGPHHAGQWDGERHLRDHVRPNHCHIPARTVTKRD